MTKFGINLHQILILALFALKCNASQEDHTNGLTIPQTEALSRFRTLFYVPSDLQRGPQYKNFPHVFYFNNAESPSILETFFAGSNKPSANLELPKADKIDPARRRRKRDILKLVDDKENEIDSVIKKEVVELEVLNSKLFNDTANGNETIEELPTPEKFFWRTNRPATSLFTFPGRLGPGFGRPFQLSQDQVRRKLARERAWLARRRARISSRSSLAKNRRRIDNGRYTGKDYFDDDEDYNYSFREDEPARVRSRDRDTVDTLDTYEHQREADLPRFPNSRIPLTERPVYAARRPYQSYNRATQQGYSMPILGRLVSSGSQLLSMLNPLNYLTMRSAYPPTSSLSARPHSRQRPVRPYRRPSAYSRRPSLERERYSKLKDEPEYTYEEEQYPADLEDDYSYRIRDTYDSKSKKQSYGSDPIYNDQEDLYERSKPQKDFPLREDLYVGEDGNIYIRNSEDEYESSAVDDTYSSGYDDTYDSKTKDDLYGLKMYGMESPKYEDKYLNSDDYRKSYDSDSTYADDRYSSKSSYGRRKVLRKRRGRPKVNRKGIVPSDRPQSKLARF